MSDNERTEASVRPRVKPIRRIITGHDSKGQAKVVSDANCPHVVPIMGFASLATTELWATSVPADNVVEDDCAAMPFRLAPPVGGATFRVVEFPPDKTIRHAIRPDQALTEGGMSNKNRMLHRTRSVDFVVVMSGEIWCVMDEGEVLMRAGDTMIQRGTNHDWQNRTDAPARVAFVLIDAQPIPGLD